jgi:hypothetical protein
MSIRILTCTKLTSNQPQLWAVTGEGTLISTWQLAGTEAAPQWMPWQKFPGPPGTLRSLMAANLLDGRPQLWAVTTESGIFTVHKNTTASDSGWSAWEKFPDF